MCKALTWDSTLPNARLGMTAVTGLVDAVSYLSLGHVFTAKHDWKHRSSCICEYGCASGVLYCRFISPFPTALRDDRFHCHTNGIDKSPRTYESPFPQMS